MRRLLLFVRVGRYIESGQLAVVRLTGPDAEGGGRAQRSLRGLSLLLSDLTNTAEQLN